MERSLGIGLVVILLVVGTLGVLPAASIVTAGEHAATSELETDSQLSAAQSDEVDNEQFKLTIHENGTAQWTFQTNRHLDDEEEVEQFETFAAEFNDDEDHQLFADFRDQATALVRNADDELDREMAARQFEREAGVETDTQGNSVGVVRMSFYWEGFGDQQDDRVVVGDIYEGGHYIGEDQWIVFEAGDGLVFSEYEPTETGELSGSNLTDSDSITWKGEEVFSDNQPRAVLQPADAVDEEEINGEPNENPDESDNNPWMLFTGIIVLVLGIGIIAAWRRDATVFEQLVTADAAETSTDSTEPSASESTGDSAVPDEELLTDEARVTSLLEENGGRMKQVRIVEETGWSKSKVSMLLSDMEDEGDLSKLRVGRENIISLDGHEPEAAGSPFEDE
ncbi:helix-turn-helix transcriptional regulator [Natranaeroarchaeum aerophilus]|uniref:HTH iclR-type domain-containing protein n=1 Tax=Natranaeroarchaeum aerophilus TaxID=2917711 RepID=A0AAE3FP86_9EURY|nr:hypothetical protein [Natranaeroarchaeum aerophilus]MCL9813092.1 hypothetical protein [Natranaeroarchaeum aerophilus]